jgi:hypothetical protein
MDSRAPPRSSQPVIYKSALLITKFEIILFSSRETYTQHSIHSCENRNHQTELSGTPTEGVINRY